MSFHLNVLLRTTRYGFVCLSLITLEANYFPQKDFLILLTFFQWNLNKKLFKFKAHRHKVIKCFSSFMTGKSVESPLISLA